MTANAYTVRAIRWEHGWELHVDDVGVTQCATLDQADRQVRDYICTALDLDRYDGGTLGSSSDEFGAVDADAHRLEADAFVAVVEFGAVVGLVADGFDEAVELGVAVGFGWAVDACGDVEVPGVAECVYLDAHRSWCLS